MSHSMVTPKHRPTSFYRGNLEGDQFAPHSRYLPLHLQFITYLSYQNHWHLHIWSLWCYKAITASTTPELSITMGSFCEAPKSPLPVSNISSNYNYLSLYSATFATTSFGSNGLFLEAGVDGKAAHALLGDFCTKGTISWASMHDFQPRLLYIHCQT